MTREKVGHPQGSLSLGRKRPTGSIATTSRAIALQLLGIVAGDEDISCGAIASENTYTQPVGKSLSLDYRCHGACGEALDSIATGWTGQEAARPPIEADAAESDIRS